MEIQPDIKQQTQAVAESWETTEAEEELEWEKEIEQEERMEETSIQKKRNIAKIEKDKWNELKKTSPLKRKRHEWSEHYDDTSGAYWYWNAATEECTWEQPYEWNDWQDATAEVIEKEEIIIQKTDIPKKEKNDKNDKNEEKNLKHVVDTDWEIGGNKRKEMNDDTATGHWGQMPADTATNWNEIALDSPLRRVVGLWEEHYDPSSECYWYYNTTTEEHTWEQPKHWATEQQMHKYDASVQEENKQQHTKQIEKVQHDFTNGPLSPVGWPSTLGDNNDTDWDTGTLNIEKLKCSKLCHYTRL